MISPGFFGFYNSYRGLLAAQMSLNTVSHNISNANTPGYTRQRVDLEAHFPYSLSTQIGQDMSRGQLGQGVQVTGVSRIRDAFIDDQFRQENARLGFNTQYKDTLQQIEGILNEPSTSGNNKSIQNFFDAAQALSLNPQNMAVRADFLQHAVDMLTVFQQQANQLVDLQRNLVGDPAVPGSFGISQLAINTNDINNLLTQVAGLNRQILTVNASGATPNDLYDQRDLMLDQLSNLVDYEVTFTPNGQLNIDIAGQSMIRGVVQTDSLQVVVNPAAPPASDYEPSLVQTVTGGVDIINNATPITGGKILAIVESAGQNNNITSVRGTIDSLDLLLGTIVTELNTLQAAGRDLSGNVPAVGDPIFQGADIFTYSVDQELLDDPGLVAASEGPPGAYLGPGDGSNGLLMAQLRDGAFAALGNTGFIDYFNGMTSNLGIDTRTYTNRSNSQSTLMDSLTQRKESVSGVNMDEELIDMVRFQRAFEATSKTIQVFDEVVQTIINMVG